MITKVSSFNTCEVVKDPRRKSQRPQFKDKSHINYKSNYNEEQQPANTFWSNMFIILGPLMFMAGYLLLTRKGKS